MDDWPEHIIQQTSQVLTNEPSQMLPEIWYILRLMKANRGRLISIAQVEMNAMAGALPTPL